MKYRLVAPSYSHPRSTSPSSRTMDLLPFATGSSKKILTVLLPHFSTRAVKEFGWIDWSKNHIAQRYRVSIEGHVVESVSILAKVEGPKRFNIDASFLADDTEEDFPSWAAGVAHGVQHTRCFG